MEKQVLTARSIVALQWNRGRNKIHLKAMKDKEVWMGSKSALTVAA